MSIDPKLIQIMSEKIPLRFSEERLTKSLLCHAAKQLVNNTHGVNIMEDDNESLYFKCIRSILAVLQESPAKASEIARRTGIPKEDVNSFLYRPLTHSGLVRQDGDYVWHLR